AGFPFTVSCANLHGDFEPDRIAFMTQVHREVVAILQVGLPPRVKMLSDALRAFYGTTELRLEHFIIR
ncbi:elongation factor P hydroxylase, partial [Vibrio sp. V05_P4A8T149]|uniref:elongation factor P hydroxylase n=1 Tax=Vibrio sp. V05_P4A8T149 TaxID=1938660 RepID=UPI000B9F224B